MACYYIVISSTHLRDGQLRSIKGVFRGPIGTNGQRNTEEGDSRFYCELCDKQYVRHQQYDNHINSYDHHHKQRLKELKQREFYRALACRRQRRRREEKKEERALRRTHQHEEKKTGECAPGSGPMFRSTTVAVDPANQSIRPDFVQSWADMHPNSGTVGTNAERIQPFLPLDPTLDNLSNTQWALKKMDAAAAQSPILNDPRLDYNHLNRPLKKLPWAQGYLNKPITPNNIPTTATNHTVASTDIKGSRAASGASDVQSRVRPVSFSLPKRSCVLLHQSAAVFIQGSGVSGKQDAKNLGEKSPDQQLKSPLSAEEGVVSVDHWDTGNQCSADSKAAIQHSDAGAIVSTESGTAGLCGPEAQVPLCNRNVIGVEDSIISGKGAQLSLCNDNGTGAQVGSVSGTGAHFYFNSGMPRQSSDSVNPDSACRELTGTKEAQKSILDDLKEAEESSCQTQPKESNSSKESTAVPPRRPKEPFCQVLSRDGSRVLLWPTEMVSYTKTSPSISYSVNPLLYDFRAHNRARDGGEEKKGGLEERRERIKPSVIKQPDCQERQEDTEGGREVKIDEREEDDEGGQAGNPMELVAHCSGSDAVPDRSGCRDESAFKFVPVSVDCHHTPTLGLQNTGGRRGRRRKRRGGVRRGTRKRGRRKRGEEANRKESERGRRIISSLCVNQMFEGSGEERLRREGTAKEESREKGLLSNLAAHRLVGGKEKKMKGEGRRIREDQAERERAGRNDEKRGELLSNLPVNRCNRCNQLCLQVKREASQHQSQQSASGWGQGLRKLLCRGAACNSVISPVPGSVIETPCCPAITPDPAQNNRETGVMHKNTRAGQGGEEQRNLRKTEITAAQDAKENACDLAISSVPLPCRDAAGAPRIRLVPEPHRETARHAAISLVSAPFRETACSQRQTIATGHSGPALGPTPRRSSPQTGTELGIRSSCSGMNLCDTLSEEAMQNGEASATSRRKRGLPEADGTPRKKRKRGRRQTRRGVSGSACDAEASCPVDLTETPELNETLSDSGSAPDMFKRSCDDVKGGEEKVTCSEETPFNDCDTPRDHDQDYSDPVVCNAVGCHMKGDRVRPNTADAHADGPSEASLICSTDDQCKHTKKERISTESQRNDCDYKQIKNKSDHSEEEEEPQCLTPHKNKLSESGIDYTTCRGTHQRGDSTDSGQCDYFNSNHAADCNHCANAVDNNSTRNEDAAIERKNVEKKKEEEEEEVEEVKQLERKMLQEEWLRRKERERERRKEMGFEPLYTEKLSHFAHRLPPPCVPLHAPLLLPPSLSSTSSSSFSFHHTIIQHHLSLLPPPPPSHLPVTSYPHLLPSFSPHLALNPPPPPPAPPFYASSPIPLLEAPGPYPLAAAAFHPPPLYPTHHHLHHPHPAVLPLQVLF